MLRSVPLASFAGLVLASFLIAQDPAPQRVDAPVAKALPDVGTMAERILDLGNDDAGVRQQAERALRAMGEVALPQLREAALEQTDAEVKWRVQRIVQQIERGAAKLGKRQSEPLQQAPDLAAPLWPRDLRLRALGLPMQDRFEGLFRSLEQDFGIDVARGRFFQNEFFRDLQQQLDAMRAQQQSAGGAAAHREHSRQMQVQVGPDGVRVLVKTKTDKGEEVSKVYEAPDMATFRAKYPGVLDGKDGGGLPLLPMQDDVFQDGSAQDGFGFVMPEESDSPSTDLRDQGLSPATNGAAVLPPEGQRLGIVVRAMIAPAVREYLGLCEGEGLQVDQVQPDTLAVALGLLPGDIITNIGSVKIGDPKSVRDALAGIDAGAAVEVLILRRGKEQTVTAAKPAANPAANPAVKSDSAPKLQQRVKPVKPSEIR